MPSFSGFEHIIRENEPIANGTWFRVGGPAQYFAEPTSISELAGLVRRCRDENVPVRVLGGGSNVLLPDEGVTGLVIHLAAPAFSEIRVSGKKLIAGGGAKLGHVISTAVREGLAGLEPLVGIPGTIGGALRLNAGANGSDIGQLAEQATVMDRLGEMIVHERSDLRFAYRESSLDELVILQAEFALEEEDAEALTKRMQTLWIVRRSSQPQGTLNMGCIFKDVGGISAASLIEQAGLKYAQVGQAAVSDVNANFIIARPGAKAADVVSLIELLRSGVAERLGIALEAEIQIWQN
ncbi:MAG: UDP-N-acetylmuramate dehydrogenase [Pirellulaceae bacterium]